MTEIQVTLRVENLDAIFAGFCEAIKAAIAEAFAVVAPVPLAPVLPAASLTPPLVPEAPVAGVDEALARVHAGHPSRGKWTPKMDAILIEGYRAGLGCDGVILALDQAAGHSFAKKQEVQNRASMLRKFGVDLPKLMTVPWKRRSPEQQKPVAEHAKGAAAQIIQPAPVARKSVDVSVAMALLRDDALHAQEASIDLDQAMIWARNNAIDVDGLPPKEAAARINAARREFGLPAWKFVRPRGVLENLPHPSVGAGPKDSYKKPGREKRTP